MVINFLITFLKNENTSRGNNEVINKNIAEVVVVGGGW